MQMARGNQGGEEGRTNRQMQEETSDTFDKNEPSSWTLMLLNGHHHHLLIKRIGYGTSRVVHTRLRRRGGAAQVLLEIGNA